MGKTDSSAIIKAMPELKKLIASLKEKDDVDAVFLTGSCDLPEASAASDIDIVIILKENRVRIKTAYQIIDGAFADIFFFDHQDLHKILAAQKIAGNTMDGILVSWLNKAKILFDKSGLTTKAEEHAWRVDLFIPQKEYERTAQEISYNYIQNRRYYESENETYREALGIRLLYSVTELITGFLTIKGEPWRGEKHAITFFKHTDSEFHGAFQDYQASTNLVERMRAYEKMVDKIRSSAPLFNYREPICLSKDECSSGNVSDTLKTYWRNLTS
ncbi:MAG: nucleotidyltransferase domain-containing protein [Patescibacteria group bacterium]